MLFPSNRQVVFGLRRRMRSSSVSRTTLSLTICCGLSASVSLMGQTLQNYSYTAWETQWADYRWYAQDYNLGVEVDSGSCVGHSPVILKNEFAYYSGVNLDVRGMPLLTNGSGSWISSAATFSGIPTLYPESNSISIFTGNGTGAASNYFMAVSASGQLTVTETGTASLRPNQLYYVTAGTMFWSSKETIDLNTGEDTWRYTAHASGTGTNNCSFTGDLSVTSDFPIKVRPISDTTAFGELVIFLILQGTTLVKCCRCQRPWIHLLSRARLARHCAIRGRAVRSCSSFSKPFGRSCNIFLIGACLDGYLRRHRNFDGFSIHLSFFALARKFDRGQRARSLSIRDVAERARYAHFLHCFGHLE